MVSSCRRDRSTGPEIPLDERERRENHLVSAWTWGCAMTSRSTLSRQCRKSSRALIPGALDGRRACRALRRAVALAALAVILAVVASPCPAHAWWYGRAIGPAVGGYAWGPAPWVPFPLQGPRPDYRYSMPPGAPLSYDDPERGTIYCWSQAAGSYFVCGYAPPHAVSVTPVLPAPARVVPSPGERKASPASGVLLFRLPKGAEAAINGVPVGLSDGLGIHALPPGPHTVVLHVSGKETVHTVIVRSHRIFTVTPSGVVATEP